MKKQPSGWFISKETKEMVIVMRKKDESDAQANKRVATNWGIDPSEVHSGPPPAGNPEAVLGWIIDLPDKPAGLSTRPERARPTEVDPLSAVTRYNERIASQDTSATTPASISSILTSSTEPMLGPRPLPETRSTPETETKKG